MQGGGCGSRALYYRGHRDEDKLKALINLLKPMGIKKIARTGTIALFREPN